MVTKYKQNYRGRWDLVSFYRIILEKYIDLEGVTDEKLREALEQIGRDLVYNFFVFGKDVTFDIFLNNLNVYLNMVNKVSEN